MHRPSPRGTGTTPASGSTAGSGSSLKSSQSWSNSVKVNHLLFLIVDQITIMNSFWSYRVAYRNIFLHLNIAIVPDYVNKRKIKMHLIWLAFHYRIIDLFLDPISLLFRFSCRFGGRTETWKMELTVRWLWMVILLYFKVMGEGGYGGTVMRWKFGSFITLGKSHLQPFDDKPINHHSYIWKCPGFITKISVVICCQNQDQE